MFEKEADLHASIMAWDEDVDTWETIAERSFQQGAEFGYNFAKEEIDYLNKHWRSEEERKANEWHYVKDRLPKELHDVLCFVIHNEHRFVLQGYLRDGRWVLSPLGTYLNNEDVIAWKEIVLPELKESE